MNDLDISELKWVRIFTPIHIPKYLIEQIKHRDWEVEEYMQYHEINCLMENETGHSFNPFSHLYVLVNKENLTKGFLWFTVEPLTKDIHVQNYSVDKEYWGKGRAMEKVIEHIKAIKRKGKLNKIFWITNYPKHSEKYGFKPSKSILMEYSEEEDGKNIQRGSNPRKEHRLADESTEKLFERQPEGHGPESEGCLLLVSEAV